MNLRDLLLDETTKTRTENGALAFDTTKSAILDLFGIGGAGRNLEEAVVYQKISQALAEDLELGLRCLLFLGDIRGGQGERRLFKVGLRVVIETQKHPIVERFLLNVPHFTRWDYLFDLWLLNHKTYGTFILERIKKEVLKDTPSLIYKWLPKPHTHGKKKPEAKVIYKYLGITEKKYRQLLAHNRKQLKVVERTMSDKEWNKIEYDKIPSKASMLYKNAFNRHDEERYQAFLNAVENGETKINAGTIYPHELVYRAWDKNDRTVEALWKALPDYVKDKDKNILPMVDVSGSMQFRISPQSNVEALHVSIGLGLYLAERLNGEFKNHFLTFSSQPKLEKIEGSSLYQKITNIANSNWNMSTNIVLAFQVILETALKNKLTNKELPSTIVVFSDMEFDSCASFDETPFNYIKKRFEESGYQLPQVVFWNLNARNVQFPVRTNEKGVILVSGYSPTTLQYVLSGEMKSPYALMLEVLNQERYNIFEQLNRLHIDN